MTQKPKVLVIDDDLPFHGNAVMKTLEDKIDFISALNMTQARDRIQDSSEVRLVILAAKMHDYNLRARWDDPEPNTLRLVPLIKARLGCPILAVVSTGVPMIVEPLSVRMREAGCEFVLTKDGISEVEAIWAKILEILGLPPESETRSA